MANYLTMVFNSDELPAGERHNLLFRDALVAASWSHVINDRDELAARVIKLEAQLKAKKDLEVT